ncbi:TPA: NAD-dependent epimerase/dehydratase family protein [Enterobacter cloacae]|nr:NAD-dependent epimerase/dehydratase family protein [Enterobacter cloacae]
MNILITGYNGFIGKNLRLFLMERGYSNISLLGREHNPSDLKILVNEADFIFHLAGVNRPKNEFDFIQGNVELTERIISTLIDAGRKTPLVLTSSIQAERENAYGRSKVQAEQLVENYAKKTSALTYIYRLSNVFGKWCKPNYNSAVATFCYNTVNSLPINIHDASSELSLVYIDDVCESMVGLLEKAEPSGYKEVTPIYKTTVGDVADSIQKFKNSRNNLITEEVGVGLTRALYSTYLSYLQPSEFSYDLCGHTDPRGTFVEVLKTHSSGQFSFFTAHPGVTRGGHYHHTKNEKFLIIKGKACYRFRNILTDEKFEIILDASRFTIVETIPGWVHDITNVGSEELIVMLWANEIFDRSKPDTIASSLV